MNGETTIEYCNPLIGRPIFIKEKQQLNIVALGVFACLLFYTREKAKQRHTRDIRHAQNSKTCSTTVPQIHFYMCESHFDFIIKFTNPRKS